MILSHIYPLLFSGNQSNIDRLINEIKNCSPDILILTGDIIKGTWNIQKWKPDIFNSEEILRDSLNYQWDKVFSIFNRLSIPIWIAPGNHDISSYTSKYRDITREIFIKKVGKPYFVKSYKSYNFLFLNTTISNSTEIKYGLDKAQIRWLKDKLSLSSCKASFLLLHHPIWYGGFQIHPGNVNMEPSNWMQEVHPLLLDKVKIVFAGDGGDRHNFLFYEIRDNVYYYVNGSGRDGISFLHIFIGKEGIKINPHFLDIRSINYQNIKRGNILFNNYFKKIAFVLRNKFFWTGICTSCILLGLIVLIFKRTVRACHRR